MKKKVVHSKALSSAGICFISESELSRSCSFNI